MDKDYITRVIEENNRITENDTMIVYARTLKNRSEQSLKTLSRKFRISKEIELNKED